MNVNVHAKYSLLFGFVHMLSVDGIGVTCDDGRYVWTELRHPIRSYSLTLKSACRKSAKRVWQLAESIEKGMVVPE